MKTLKKVWKNIRLLGLSLYIQEVNFDTFAISISNTLALLLLSWLTSSPYFNIPLAIISWILLFLLVARTCKESLLFVISYILTMYNSVIKSITVSHVIGWLLVFDGLIKTIIIWEQALGKKRKRRER